jgi:hypothetical protein
MNPTKTSFWTGFGLGMVFSSLMDLMMQSRKKNMEMCEKNKSQKINANY